jgi:hypothetical protein
MKLLENPKTEAYHELKSLVLSSSFPWFYQNQSTENNSINYSNVPFYSHGILIRPEASGYPVKNSPHADLAVKVALEILTHNNIDYYTLLRINANCLHPFKTTLSTVPHVDHPYKHRNLLLYLTDAGGDTIVEEQKHTPKEDDALLFEGLHYGQSPMENRRINIIVTFLDSTIIEAY